MILTLICLLGVIIPRLGAEQSLSRPSRATPAGPHAIPALVQTPPAQTAQSPAQELRRELREVGQEAEEQKDPEPEQQNTEHEEDPQRGVWDPAQPQVRSKHGRFLHEQQATQTQEEDVFRDLVAPPHHPRSEALELTLAFPQHQQRLPVAYFWPGGQRFVAAPRGVLQKIQQFAEAEPQASGPGEPREVARWQGEGAADGEGEKEDEGAHKDAGPAPSGAQEQPGKERSSRLDETQSALTAASSSVFQL